MAKDVWIGDVVIRDGQGFSEAPPTVSEYLESGGATGGSRIARLRARQEAERRAEQARLAEQARRLEESYKRQAEKAEKERLKQEAEERERRSRERLEREARERETARQREQRLFLEEEQRKEAEARSKMAISEGALKTLREKAKEKTKAGFPTKQAEQAKKTLRKLEGATVVGFETTEGASPLVPGSAAVMRKTVEPVESSIRPGVIDYSKMAYSRVDEILKESIGNLIPDKVIKKTGEVVGTVAKYTSEPIIKIGTKGTLGEKYSLEFAKGTTEFRKGYVEGTIRDVRDEPTKQIAIYGAAYGLGVGTKLVGKAGTVGAGKLGSILFKTDEASKIVKSAVKTGELGILGAGIYQLGKEKIPELATATPKERGKIVGTTAKDLFIFAKGYGKGKVAGEKTIGVLRTMGRQEVKGVIDPKFFKGDTFPQISKGQTAGELLKEFKQPVLPGEKAGVGRAFTASPEAFAKQTTIKAGTSELPGLYGSPKVSPKFFRIASEKLKLFSSSDFEFGSPTAIRLEPKSIQLLPGIESTRKWLLPFTENMKKVTIKFYKTIGGTGKSYIPFIKTEKETVTAAGSKIFRTGKKFFLKFQGVRIPIDQYKVVSGTPTLIQKTKTSKTFKMFKRLDSRKTGVAKQGLISPATLTARTKIDETKTPIPSYLDPNKVLFPIQVKPKTHSFKTRTLPLTTKSYFKSSKSLITSSSISGKSKISKTTSLKTTIPSPSYSIRKSLSKTAYSKMGSSAYKITSKSPSYYSYISTSKTTISPPTRTPTFFKLPTLTGKSPKRKRNLFPRSDPLVFTGGFSARLLGVGKPIKELKLPKLARDPFALRPIPIRRKKRK